MLFRNGRWLGFHQVREPGIFAQLGKFRVRVCLIYAFVAVFHRLAQILQRAVSIAHFGVQLSDNVIVVRPVLRGSHLHGNPGMRSMLENLRIKPHRLGVGLTGMFKFFAREISRSQVGMKRSGVGLDF